MHTEASPLQSVETATTLNVRINPIVNHDLILGKRTKNPCDVAQVLTDCAASAQGHGMIFADKAKWAEEFQFPRSNTILYNISAE